MNKKSLSYLIAIDKFISGTDRSIATANEIEVTLDDAFPNDEIIQNLVLMLASYRPGGGECLYNEAQILNELLKVKKYIESK